eukprot:CAMPEP_0172508692 /NCGR_PEP_ID=MMETSP1066-20121228/213896_1 /TAXON_ID=671091 /ORGANISM="Coscinodiscus wailesii, Strain CCMP2513" /LENGTH=502 /DNA_ID=CAMNT_0013286787 /DNA_START=475 /DNA_END=1984 /DNA_ORIENTATION=+
MAVQPVGIVANDKPLGIFSPDSSLSERDTDVTAPFSGESEDKLDYYNTRYISEKDEEEFFSDAERDEDRIKYPKGIPEGFYVTKQYFVPPEGFVNLTTNGSVGNGIDRDDINRLEITAVNVTLPIALMLLDEHTYPSQSRARKACRKGHIMIHRGPLESTTTFAAEKCSRGKVPDRVYPGDVIGYQVRLHGGFYPGFTSGTRKNDLPFDLPVLYEDDHFAIVNKPAGVVCYSQRKQGHGMMTVRAALPFVLKPPRRGTLAIMRRPASVHRLDKPTSGLLLVAKTKPAMVDLTRQFVERKVRKTYTAVVNGIPDEPRETSISSKDASEMGIDVGAGVADEYCGEWQLIDHALDDKSAVTVWRPLGYVKSMKAWDGVLTLVELKPKTGRYHQLRRHMAWVRNCPIVGDSVYDGGGDAMSLRGRGLFLCSNKVSLEHPYFNTHVGRKEWNALPDQEKYRNGIIRLSKDGQTVEVHATIDLPAKFDNFMNNEQDRHDKFNGDSKSS